MLTTLLDVDTANSQVVDLTDRIAAFCSQRPRGDGLVHVFVPHATAGLALMETDPDRRPTSAPPSSGSFPAMTATCIGTDRPGTGPTTSCRRW